MKSVHANPADALLLTGATGDLAQRMLLPSLFALHDEKLISADLPIFALARRPLSDDTYRAFAEQSIRPRSAGAQSDILAAFLKRLHYVPLDVLEGKGFTALHDVLAARGVKRPAVYLSTAPSLFEPAVSGLIAAGVDGQHARIALEKPLGSDLASSREINNCVARAFPEDKIFRIDHYLGKETVQNLLALRFGNVLFEPLWNSGWVEHVQITVAETVGLESRGDYYDSAGALRDMVQNHMLQLLALLAMEAPASFDAASVRDEKVKVLRSLRPIDRETVSSHAVAGQYRAGAIGGKRVPGYLDELGRASNTETFVALKTHIDNWRWKGVPFYLRTGKRLAARQTEIVIQFRNVPHSIFAERGGALQANKLRIRLQPEEDVRLLVMAKVPGLDREGVRLRELPLDLSLSSAFAGTRRRIAYERLLLDFIEDDPTLFVRRDEVEAQWAWIDKIRDGWSWRETAPKSYDAGSWGPQGAVALTERDGASWYE